MRTLLVIVAIALANPVAFASGKLTHLKKRAAFTYEKLNEEAFLFALSMIETGRDHRAIGAGGERTAYQITARTWCAHSSKPFDYAGHDIVYDKLVAKRHLEWIVSYVSAYDRAERVEVLFAAWKFGSSRAHANQTHDYAVRAANLYYEYAN